MFINSSLNCNKINNSNEKIYLSFIISRLLCSRHLDGYHKAWIIHYSDIKLHYYTIIFYNNNTLQFAEENSKKTFKTI
uniref:Uncharacterized protein n=1 Tax=Strongyloides venezuelensis TaxID=75913 RepID=A0A0K0FL79_STRVS